MGKREGVGLEILREPCIIRSIKGPVFLYLIYLKDKVDGIDILPRLKPWDSNSRKKASLIPAKSITFGRFRPAAYATAMALGI